MRAPNRFGILVIPLPHVLGPKHERQQRPRDSTGRVPDRSEPGETSAVTSAVGDNHLPESLSGPCGCFRYHELNTHKVTKSPTHTQTHTHTHTHTTSTKREHAIVQIVSVCARREGMGERESAHSQRSKEKDVYTHNYTHEQKASVRAREMHHAHQRRARRISREQAGERQRARLRVKQQQPGKLTNSLTADYDQHTQGTQHISNTLATH